MHGCGPSTGGEPTGVHILQKEWRLPHLSGILSDLIKAGLVCYEFMCAIATPCPKDSVSYIAPYPLSTSFPAVFSEPLGAGERCCLY